MTKCIWNEIVTSDVSIKPKLYYDMPTCVTAQLLLSTQWIKSIYCIGNFFFPLPKSNSNLPVF